MRITYIRLCGPPQFPSPNITVIPNLVWCFAFLKYIKKYILTYIIKKRLFLNVIKSLLGCTYSFET